MTKNNNEAEINLIKKTSTAFTRIASVLTLLAFLFDSDGLNTPTSAKNMYM
jgi:hypothetical protein